MNNLTYLLISGIIFLASGGGTYYLLDQINYRSLPTGTVVQNIPTNYATSTFSGMPEANVRYKDKEGVRFEVYSERKADGVLDFIKTTVPPGEKLMTSIASGHPVRGWGGREVVAYLPSKKAIDIGGKAIGPIFKIGSDDRDYSVVLDRFFNLSKDDAGNFNLPLTPDAIFDDIASIYLYSPSPRSPEQVSDLMKKYGTKFIVVLPGDSQDSSQFPDDTVVVNRMMRGQNVNCFTLLKNFVATSSAGKFVTTLPRGAIYQTNDSCVPTPSVANLSVRTPLWQEDFATGAGSWKVSSSFPDQASSLPRFERQTNGDGQIYFPEYIGAAESFYKEIKVPTGAKYLTFDFYFKNASGNELLWITVGSNRIFGVLKAKDWNFTSFHSSPVIDVSFLAGTTGPLTFTVQGDGEVGGAHGGARLYIDNIKIY